MLFIILPFQQSFALAEEQFYYTSNIDHLFTHCLIAYPDIAFSKNNDMRNNYNNDCITPNEFKAILNQLYNNNYVLVDINNCFKIVNNKAEKTKVKVPKGKKPLILSFDDVNYDQKKLKKGMVDKIILDKFGNLATSTIVKGKEQISYDNEFVTILESFVAKHPDFSVNGAKGTINLTGYDGILGYRTQKNNTINRQNEIREASNVIKKLKSLGWTFASHSYGHYHMKKISDLEFKQELESWKNEVEPLVGKTNIYVYPYGEWELFNSDGSLCNKHQLLKEYGFKLFCGVGMKTFYSYLPFKRNANAEKVLFMDRKPIDGYTLKNRTTELSPLFDTSIVYDYNNRKLI